MNLKANIGIYLLLMVNSYSYGQIDQYNYKRELQGINQQWHTVALPNSIFDKVSANLSDIRIFGTTVNNDTIEMPYILQLTTGTISRSEVSFKTINSSHNKDGYYFTFEIPSKEAINQIKLYFNQQNYDWRLTLEGSQNLQQWFTVVKNYRILSIKNERTDYQFTKVVFPDSRYHYYRVLLNSKEYPDLISAKIDLQKTTDASYRDYAIRTMQVYEDKQVKETIIDVTLESPVPVSQLKIDVQDSFDHYRPITIRYLIDSIKTQQGWKYNYSTLTSGTLSSIEENKFNFNSTILQKLKVAIYNYDNQPLTIGNIKAKGYKHELVVRFTEPATYYLTYGNSKAIKPHYDLDHFAKNIPDNLQELTLQEEQVIKKNELPKTEPLFENKIWLWGIMITIILSLGWFSFNMLKKN